MSYAFRPEDLPKLDLQVDGGADFKAWKTQWEVYLSLSGLATQGDTKQVQALTLCFSRETVTIVEKLGLSADQRGKVEEIVVAAAFNVTWKVTLMSPWKDALSAAVYSSTFDDFLVSLRELAKTCKFCSDNCTQKNIRDQLIEGLLDGDTVEHLLQEKDLTLDKAITTCRAQEAAKKQ